MKRLILAACLMATTAGASVNTEVMSDEDEQESFCSVMGDLAANIMSARQNGVKMSNLMDNWQTENPTPSDQWWDRLAREMTMQAFRKPSYQTEEFKLIEIGEFRSMWELACYRQFG